MIRFNAKDLFIKRGYLHYKNKPCHRIIWEQDVGPIPKGFEIHHVDGNKLNNSFDNLQCLSKSDHMKLHALLSLERRSKCMSKNSKKVHAWLSTEVGKKFLSDKAKKQFQDRPLHKCVCAECGKEFDSKHVRVTKFCSNNCMSRDRRKSGLDNETRSCVICSEPFVINKYQLTKTCSKPCRAKHIGNLKRKS